MVAWAIVVPLSLIVALALLVVRYLTKNNDYWKKRGIPGPKPKFLVGNFPSTFSQKRSFAYELDEVYRQYKDDHDYIGVFISSTPKLLILSPELCRDVMVRYFKNFHDTEFSGSFDKDKDPLIGRNPFFLKGEEWKEKRNEVVGAFSTGRIKALFPLMEAVCKRMTDYIQREGKKQVSFETRELMAKYTTDVVANCIFAVDSGAFTHEKSEIREVAKGILDPSWRVYITIILATAVPDLAKHIQVQFVPKEKEDFLVNLLKNALEYRKKNNIDRVDYLDHLIKLKETKGISDVEMAAHTVTFFFDGIETSSLTLSKTLFELAKNKRVQNKLREILQDAESKHGKLDYDVLNDLKYLEQTFYESLRVNPVIANSSRICTETIEIEAKNDKKLVIEEGTIVLLPVYSIHLDEEYFDNPKEFRPERFDEENGGLKALMDRGVYFPFGNGPRICLGQRFALTQLKAGLASILLNFEVSLAEKMSENPKIAPGSLMLDTKGGTWLTFEPLKK